MKEVLHTLRVMGYADAQRIATRLSRPTDETTADLLDAQARGWATTGAYDGDEGWSLTESGKAADERLAAAELDEAGARTVAAAVYEDFLPHNDIVAAACTAWQLAELGIGPQNVTAEEIVDRLTTPANALAEFEARLTEHLPRFAGYHRLFTAALSKAPQDPAWITAIDRDSCHRVWFELHEDLIATLNLTR